MMKNRYGYDYSWTDNEASNVVVEPEKYESTAGFIFRALERRGYPVEQATSPFLIDLPPTVAALQDADTFDEDGRSWTRYISYVEPFTPIAAAIIASVTTDEEAVPALAKHPIKLQPAVEAGDLPLLAGWVDEVQATGSISEVDNSSIADVTTEDFVYACFRRSYLDRMYTQLGAGGIQPSSDERVFFRVFRDADMREEKPHINFDDIAEDYIQVYEREHPEIIAFRSPEVS